MLPYRNLKNYAPDYSFLPSASMRAQQPAQAGLFSMKNLRGVIQYRQCWRHRAYYCKASWSGPRGVRLPESKEQHAQQAAVKLSEVKLLPS